MKKLFFVALIIASMVPAAAAANTVTTLVCKQDDGKYWGALTIDQKKKTIKDVNVYYKYFIESVLKTPYDPEKDFQTYTITLTNDQIIRATEQLVFPIVVPEVIEINRHSLRLRYLNTGPPVREVSCTKSEKIL